MYQRGYDGVFTVVNITYESSVSLAKLVSEWLHSTLIVIIINHYYTLLCLFIGCLLISLFL